MSAKPFRLAPSLWLEKMDPPRVAHTEHRGAPRGRRGPRHANQGGEPRGHFNPGGSNPRGPGAQHEHPQRDTRGPEARHEHPQRDRDAQPHSTETKPHDAPPHAKRPRRNAPRPFQSHTEESKVPTHHDAPVHTEETKKPRRERPQRERPQYGEPRVFTVQPAKYTKIRDIDPESVGINIKVVVVEIAAPTGTEAKRWVVKVADDTGSVDFLLADAAIGIALRPGTHMTLRNVYVEMHNHKFIQLHANGWSKLDVEKQPHEFVSRPEPNMSAVEYEIEKD